MVKGGTTYRLVSDPLGSVRLVVDATTGTVAQKIDYDEFGRITSDTSPGFQPFGFAGGLYDPDTGLTRFGARDYDAETGRFTTKDPSGFRGGQNFYEYAGSDPVNYIDPDGHLAFLIPIAIAIAMAEGAAMGASLELLNQAMTTGCLDVGAVENAAMMGALLGGLGRGIGALAEGACFVAGTPVATEHGEVPIEKLRLGNRVSAGNPQCANEHLAPDAQTIRLEIPNPQQPLDTTRVEVARPVSWLRAQPSDDGKVWIELDEIGLSGWATVTSIQPAPQEESGSGCLVLTTVEHLASEILRIRVGEGQETLELTPTHRLYVEGVGWTLARDLKGGNLLRSDTGSLVVDAVEAASPNQHVYNIEVGLEHTYRVGHAALWAHNTCPPPKGGTVLRGTNETGWVTSRTSWRKGTVADAWERAGEGYSQWARPAGAP